MVGWLDRLSSLLQDLVMQRCGCGTMASLPAQQAVFCSACCYMAQQHPDKHM
jgi:hypothetical protein